MAGSVSSRRLFKCADSIDLWQLATQLGMVLTHILSPMVNIWSHTRALMCSFKDMYSRCLWIILNTKFYCSVLRTLFLLFSSANIMAFGRLIIFATLFAPSDGSNKKPFLAAPNPQMEKQRQQDLIRALFAKYRKWEIDLRRCSKYKVLNIHQSRKYKKHVQDNLNLSRRTSWHREGESELSFRSSEFVETISTNFFVFLWWKHI